MNQDASIRRIIVRDLMENYPEIDDIDYNTILNSNLNDFHKYLEERKMDSRMNRASIMI